MTAAAILDMKLWGIRGRPAIAEYQAIDDLFFHGEYKGVSLQEHIQTLLEDHHEELAGKLAAVIVGPDFDGAREELKDYLKTIIKVDQHD